MARGERRQNLARLGEIAQVAARHGFGYAVRAERRVVRGDDAGARQPRPAHARDARRARTDVRQVRPAALHAARTWCRPTSWPSSAASRTTRTPSRSTGSGRWWRPSSASRSSRCSWSSTRRPSRPRRSGRCTWPGCPAGSRWWSRSSAPTPSASSTPTSSCSTRWPASRRTGCGGCQFIDLVGTVDEFARTVRRELDYGIEARNAEVFRRDFAGDDRGGGAEGLLAVHARPGCSRWSGSRGRCSASSTSGRGRPTTASRLGNRITETWMQMVFVHGFFHADPHPANILVRGPDQHQPGRLRDDRAAHPARPRGGGAAAARHPQPGLRAPAAAPARPRACGTRAQMEEELGDRLGVIVQRYSASAIGEIDAREVLREIFQTIYRLDITLPGAVGDARQDGRDARRGRAGDLSRPQRLRGGAPLRGAHGGAALPARPHRRPGAGRHGPLRRGVPRVPLPGLGAARRVQGRRDRDHASGPRASTRRSRRSRPAPTGSCWPWSRPPLILGSAVIAVFAHGPPTWPGLSLIAIPGAILALAIVGLALRRHLPLGPLVSWRARRVAFARGRGPPGGPRGARARRVDPGAPRASATRPPPGSSWPSDGPLAPPEDLPGIAEAADRLARAVRRGERDRGARRLRLRRHLLDGDPGAGAAARAAPTSWPSCRAASPRATASPRRRSSAWRPSAARGCWSAWTAAPRRSTALTRAVDLGMDAIVLDHHLAGGRRPPGILANPALGRPDDDLPGRRRRGAHGRARAGRPPGRRRPGPGPGRGHRPRRPRHRRRRRAPARRQPAAAWPRACARCASGRGRASPPSAPRRGSSRALVTAHTLGFTLAPASTRPAGWRTPAAASTCCWRPTARRPTRSAPSSGSSTPSAAAVEREILEAGRRPARGRAGRDPRRRGDRGAAGDGWHEGVVGHRRRRGWSSASSGRRSCISRQGDDGQGLGAEPAGRQPARAGGGGRGDARRAGAATPGAVGLELPRPTVARFRDDLMLAAEGARAAIARARVRTVDAVVGARDLTLATAEAIEALAPFGRGNPAGAAGACPAPSWSRRRGWGRGKHLQVRLRSGGVHARAIGFRMGERAAGIALDERHDALDLARDRALAGRWSARGSRSDALQEIPVARRPARAGARRPATSPAASGSAARPARDGRRRRRAGLAEPRRPPRSPPLGVRDRRGRGRLAGACWRPSPGPTAAWSPSWPTSPGAAARWRRRWSRGGWGSRWRCSAAGAATRAPWRPASRCARGVPALLMVDYARLAETEPPEGMHLVLVDPPADRRRRGLGGGPGRRAAGCTWRGASRETELALRGGRGGVGAAPGRRRPSGPGCATASGARGGPTSSGSSWATARRSRPPRVAARALRGAGGGRPGGGGGATASAPPSTRARRDLTESALYRACRERLTEARAHLARAQTLDLLARHEVPEGALTG